jgi:hypothetical protein
MYQNEEKIMTIHRMAKIVEYSTWHDMKNRCYNINNKAYKIYGKKDIVICERWKNFYNSSW